MKSDNELIAEFMGGVRGDIDSDVSDLWFFGDKHEKYLRYDTSWDWLMPVVEKIEALEHVFIIDGNQANIMQRADVDKGLILKEYPTKIQSVFAASVEFIKWYNTQTTHLKQY